MTTATATPRRLSPIAERAAQIRAAYKVAGIKASVIASNYSMGSSITIRVRSGSFKRAEEIANEHESISRCKITGEILSGGNRYVDVMPDGDLVDALRDKHRPAVEAALRAVVMAEVGVLQPIAGTPFAISWAGGRGNIWNNERRPAQFDSLLNAEYLLANLMAREG